MSILQRLGFTVIRTKLKILGLFSKQQAALYAFKLFCTPRISRTLAEPVLFKNAAKLSLTTSGHLVRGYGFNMPQQRKVLILHGFSSSAVNFESYIQPLVDKGFEVLAFDAPAHGASEGKQVNVLMYKQMILDIIHQFGPINCLIGHSFGGLAISLSMEEEKPEPETKLILIAPAAETTTAINQAFDLLDINDANLKNNFNKIIEERAGCGPEWFSVNRALRQFNADILIVQDEDDQVTPLSDLQSLIDDKLPYIRFIITKNLGHNKIYRDKKVIEQIVNFAE